MLRQQNSSASAFFLGFEPMSVFQGARFMSTAMYDAREALIPGSAYDRSSAGQWKNTSLIIVL
jgi:hypothetical protein